MKFYAERHFLLYVRSEITKSTKRRMEKFGLDLFFVLTV